MEAKFYFVSVFADKQDFDLSGGVSVCTVHIWHRAERPVQT